MITLNHYLLLSALLFSIGTAGIILRRNLIALLLSEEIMLDMLVVQGRANLRPCNREEEEQRTRRNSVG